MKRIYLIGYMGAGKTTLGAPIAQRLGWTFIDLDVYIENRRHKTVSELFALYGEDKFREIERDILREVSTFENVIISTGGGTPCFFDNLELMNQSGMTIYLQVEVPVLFERLKLGRRKRPKLRDKNDEELLQFIKDGLSARLPIYEQAFLHVDANDLESLSAIDKSTSIIVDSILEKSK